MITDSGVGVIVLYTGGIGSYSTVTIKLVSKQSKAEYDFTVIVYSDNETTILGIDDEVFKTLEGTFILTLFKDGTAIHSQCVRFRRKTNLISYG